MVAFNEKIVTDKSGKTVGILLDVDDFRRMVEELEELDSLRAYDAAKSSHEQPVPFEQAVAEIEQDRKK